MTQPYEHCSICDSLTGKAGAADDSIFWLEGAIGPLCDECHDTLQAEVLDNVGLPANAADELERLQRERDELLKEVELFIRAIHADPYSDFEPDKIQELFTAIVERFDDGMDALAIVAKLPQCWQFNDDKTALVQECPVVPGMVVWWAIGDIPWTGVVRATFCNYLLAFTEDGLKWSKESTLVHSDCFDSAAAAEFATQQAMKE